MKIGYARVSTKEQNLDRQLQNLEEQGCDKVYTDKQSGKDFNRPSYQKMIANLQKDDVLVLHSLDRLGRNYDEIIAEWSKITKVIGADIIVLDMPLLNTTTNGKDLTGKFIADIVLQILSYVAENERNNIRKRQAEGIAIAKAKGVYKGRKPLEIDMDKFNSLKSEYQEHKINADIFADEMGISRSKLFKLLREVA